MNDKIRPGKEIIDSIDMVGGTVARFMNSKPIDAPVLVALVATTLLAYPVGTVVGVGHKIKHALDPK